MCDNHACTASVNADAPAEVLDHRVSDLPTLLLIVDGHLQQQHAGLLATAQLRDLIKRWHP